MELVILSIKDFEITKGVLEDFDSLLYEIKWFKADKGELKFKFSVCKMFLKRIDISFKEMWKIQKRKHDMQDIRLMCEYGNAVHPFLLFTDVEKAEKVRKLILKLRISEVKEKTEILKVKFFDTVQELESLQDKLKSLK